MRPGEVIMAVLVAAIFGLTAWVFYLTRNPWSFLILLLVSSRLEASGSNK